MIAPLIGASLISGAASLIGGIFGRKSAKKDAAWANAQEAANVAAANAENRFLVDQQYQRNVALSDRQNEQQRLLVSEQNAEQRKLLGEMNSYNDPAAIRARAEGAGFNPMLFVGPGVGLQSALPSVGVADVGAATAGVASVGIPGVSQPGFNMGESIANAGLALGQGISAQAELNAYNSALAQQNAELRKAVERANIRPNVPGIFGTAQPVKVPVTSNPGIPALNGGTIPPVPYGKQVDPAIRYPSYVETSGRPPEVPGVIWTGYESDGQVTWVPEGPDADEVASGLLLVEKHRRERLAGSLRYTRENARRFDPNHRDGYFRTGSPYTAN